MHGHSEQQTSAQEEDVSPLHDYHPRLQVSYVSPAYCLFTSLFSAENSVRQPLGVITHMFIIQKLHTDETETSMVSAKHMILISIDKLSEPK